MIACFLAILYCNAYAHPVRMPIFLIYPFLYIEKKNSTFCVMYDDVHKIICNSGGKNHPFFGKKKILKKIGEYGVEDEYKLFVSFT